MINFLHHIITIIILIDLTSILFLRDVFIQNLNIVNYLLFSIFIITFWFFVVYSINKDLSSIESSLPVGNEQKKKSLDQHERFMHIICSTAIYFVFTIGSILYFSKIVLIFISSFK